jgi:hypothetical protein
MNVMATEGFIKHPSTFFIGVLHAAAAAVTGPGSDAHGG